MRLTVHGTSGPFVVKLAGIAGGTGLYREEMEAAASAGYRVIALETTGDLHDDPAPWPLSWDGFSRDLEAGLDRAGAERAVLWGTSFGCLVALACAARLPSRVSGLLLCHPPDPLFRPARYVGLLEWSERRRRADLAARLLFSAGFITLTSWEGVMPRLWSRLPALLSASLEAATPPSTVRGKLALLFRDDPGLPSNPSLPIEIVVGAWDLVAPLSRARGLASRLPSARMTVMGFSGHAGAYTRPSTYRRVVQGALARLSSHAK
ncbi:MAG TPA: alpha/beta hydrolase [Candidatus Polarisedimenticolaceae bacterium]|nr:alpha/beta hydrolase [Candidatus Polarisedimenticolaceae bacterium]